MIKKIAIALAFTLASCAAPGSGSQETYQRILGLLCSAPPNIMANVLVTPELQKAWQTICAHVGSVPATPVVQSIANNQ
jgi:hypothetical protein